MTQDRGPEIANQETCRLTRNELAVIISVDSTVTAILGWAPDELIGSSSTTFVHPDDQAGAVGAWLDMLAKPGARVSWRGRYRTATGDWQWVETVNVNRLDDPTTPVVETLMQRVAPEQLSMAEELRARRQLLGRLAEAVPVGIFQVSSNLKLSFMNDQFLDMFGPSPAATAEAQFRRVVNEDRPALRRGFAAAFSNELVDGIELRFHPPGADATGPTPRVRVCLMNLRPLTDDRGEVSGAIGVVSDVTESVQLRRELEIRATVDGATGCLNHQATMDLLDLVLGTGSDRGSGVAVVFIDIDKFKNVNDRHGHVAGDAVLVHVSATVRRVIRDRDHLGRLGGDEFLVVCPDVVGPATAMEVAERIAQAIRLPIMTGDRQIELQASVGVAWTERPATTDSLIGKADRAMYHSKEQGEGRPVLASADVVDGPQGPAA